MQVTLGSKQYRLPEEGEKAGKGSGINSYLITH